MELARLKVIAAGIFCLLRTTFSFRSWLSCVGAAACPVQQECRVSMQILFWTNICKGEWIDVDFKANSVDV